MRNRIVAGNWKMNTTITDGVALCKDVLNLSANLPQNVTLVVAPPFTHISEILKALENTQIAVGTQNCAAWEKGAYTGEVSAAMIAACGAKYVIIGHSERREYFNESNETLLAKVNLALNHQLTPIFCCGEKLNERDENRHFNVVKEQIEEVLFRLNGESMQRIVIAYEPVWAIGTGRTATPEQAQEMHAHIRLLLSNHFGNSISQSISILYGGSCKPDNAQEIFSKPDVDGGLIGGASLVATDFIAIAKSFPE